MKDTKVISLSEIKRFEVKNQEISVYYIAYWFAVIEIQNLFRVLEFLSQWRKYKWSDKNVKPLSVILP